jgi:CBS domain-containing protein
MSTSPANMTTNQRVEFLARLREARALVLRDAESFHEASTVLEHIGQVIGRKIGNGLKDHEADIVSLATSVAHANGEAVRRLFNVVREARNKAVHDGAYARHLNSRLVDLVLILEEAIMAKLDCVEDLMVRNPVFAEPWHLVSHVRKAMLANSFSNIPIFVGEVDNGKWMLLTDTAIMRFIRNGVDKRQQRTRLAMQVDLAITQRLLEVEPAVCCRAGTLIGELTHKMNERPVLVTEKIHHQERLIGIITAFDLL